MFGEIDVLGAFMPRAVILFVIGLLIFAVADRCLTKMRFYKCFWHPPLARLALFVCLFCLGGWFASIH
jgi:uncharacterized protein DUF1656